MWGCYSEPWISAVILVEAAGFIAITVMINIYVSSPQRVKDSGEQTRGEIFKKTKITFVSLMKMWHL